MTTKTTKAPTKTAATQAKKFVTTYKKIKDEVGRMMVGQDEVIDGVLTALLAGGHVLLEGVPGLGKRCSSAPWEKRSTFTSPESSSHRT